MRYSEFKLSNLRAFEVTVRLQTGRAIKTVIFAETQAWAIALAKQAYGQQNVLSIVEDVSHKTKPLPPEQQRIKSLNDQAKRYRDLAKKQRAQLKVNRAKEEFFAVNSSTQPRSEKPRY